MLRTLVSGVVVQGLCVVMCQQEAVNLRHTYHQNLFCSTLRGASAIPSKSLAFFSFFFLLAHDKILAIKSKIDSNTTSLCCTKAEGSS